MNIAQLLDRNKEFIHIRNEFEKNITEFISNKNNKLEERWEVFTLIPMSMPAFTNQWIMHYKIFGSDKNIDDLYFPEFDRHELIDNIDYYESIIESYEYIEDPYDYNNKKVIFYMNQILDNKIRYWYFDW